MSNRVFYWLPACDAQRLTTKFLSAESPYGSDEAELHNWE